MSNKDTAAFAATQHPIKTNLDENALQTAVTLLRGTNPAPTGYGTLGEVFARMRNADPAKREKVLALRQLAYKAKSEGDETAYKDQKETLSGFLVGRWTRRSDAPENCTQYAPFLVLDFDYSCFYEPDAPPFSSEVCQEVFLKICSDPYTFAAFMSPSGGLRVTEPDATRLFLPRPGCKPGSVDHFRPHFTRILPAGTLNKPNCPTTGNGSISTWLANSHAHNPGR